MLVILPLLHVTQTVVSAGPGLTACLAVLAAAVALGAAAGAFSRLRRRVRRRLEVLACSLLLLLAVTPSVLPYDHLLTAVRPHEDAVVHASHCHDTPSSCADAPVASGPGQILDSAPLLVVPAMVAVLLILVTTVPTGITRRPALRPPLLLSVTSN